MSTGDLATGWHLMLSVALFVLWYEPEKPTVNQMLESVGFAWLVGGVWIFWIGYAVQMWKQAKADERRRKAETEEIERHWREKTGV